MSCNPNRWGSIHAMVSDLCSVNKGLEAERSSQLGLSDVPGQIFCNLHYVLAVLADIKSVMLAYQSSIGGVKLFPHTTGFDMRTEDTLKCAIAFVQVLDVFLRVTSIRCVHVCYQYM